MIGAGQLPDGLLDDALNAFWQVIVQRFPEATTGDLSPMTTVRLSIAAEEAVGEWVRYNAPSEELDA